MNAGIIAGAAGLFAVTNVDDILVLSLFFGRGNGQPGAGTRIVAGQYLGFSALLAVTVGAACGAAFLPRAALAYLGLLPLALGLRSAWEAWKGRRGDDRERDDDRRPDTKLLPVAAVTFANGSDDIGVYLPVFARSGVAAIIVYIVVFLVLVAVWCAAGWFFATRPAVARVISRWGHVLHPAVLITLGLFIMLEGGAFGL